MQKLYALYTGGVIELEAPFLHLLKGDVVRLADDLGVPVEKTHSCESGDYQCGRCQSCVDRNRLLTEMNSART
jgi:7-cyano-7-deazaguanine synthase